MRTHYPEKKKDDDDGDEDLTRRNDNGVEEEEDESMMSNPLLNSYLKVHSEALRLGTAHEIVDTLFDRYDLTPDRFTYVVFEREARVKFFVTFESTMILESNINDIRNSRVI